MSNVKHQPAAMRRNVAGKADYLWTATYTNGNRVLFDSPEAASEYAAARCAQPELCMYAPHSILRELGEAE